MGRAKFLKSVIVGFYELYDYQYWKICWHELFNCSNFYIQFYPAHYEYFGTFFLKFMCPWKAATLLFEFNRTFAIDQKLIIIAVDISYYKWHFYYYFHVLHYRWINWITWTYTHCIFPFPFDCKSSYRKIKIIPIDLSLLRTQTHAQNYCQLWEIFCKVVIFKHT